MQVADNVVFIGLAPGWFVRARQEDMRQCAVRPGGVLRPAHPARLAPVRHRVTAGWARRGWQGAIAHTRLLEESPGR